MKRKLIAFSMTMALLLSVFSAANVGAFTATIEAPALSLLPSRAEWSFAKESDGSGITVLQRNSTQQGAYIFNDTTDDQRLITTTEPVTREADLDFFAVTADANNIYFLAKVEKYTGIQNDPSIELMIMIDTNQTSGQGTTALPFVTGTYSTTQVAADAAWEYTLDVQFRKGTGGFVSAPNAFRVFTDATSSTNCTGCLAQLAASIPTGSFVEISVPWSRIPNAKPAGANYLRFAVATMYSSAGASNRQVPADGYNSPVIDVLGNGSTLADLQDGTIDTSFDVHFNTNGAAPTYEPYAPLMVTEFQPNPIGSDSPGPTNPSTETEWIEIYNPNSFAIPLSDYKIGNTPKRGSSQGMYKFNASSIAAGAAVIVAKEKSRFLAGHPGYTGTVYDLSSDMTQYTAWASGDLQLDNQPSTGPTSDGTFEEQVVLLDAKDGIVDMATYGNTAEPYPGHTPIAISAVPEGASYERCPALRDTNNSNVDFTVHNTPGEQTPGQACVGVPGLDLTVAKTGPTNPLRSETTSARYVNYTITYSNIGVAAENAAVTVVDTLPAGLSFNNTPDNASPQPNTVSPDGKVLTWNFPTGLAAGANGTIVLTATVDSDVGQNVPLANNVSISGPSELEAARTNNTAQWTTITPGPADTSVSSNLSGSVPPGSQFQFTIVYQNTGQDDATDVVITNVLPAGVTILSENSPTATWNNATTGTVTWNVGTLPPNTSGTIVVTARLDSAAVIGSPLPNSLSITVPLNDPTPDNNAEAKTLTVGLRKLYLPVQLR